MAIKTIILADDHPLIHKGITTMLEQHTNYKIIATVKDGKALLQKLNSIQPDMVLLDINMPVLDGRKAAQLIQEKYPDIKIVFLSIYWDLAFAHELQSINASGFIAKLAEPEVFISAITRIMNGEKVFMKVNEQETETAQNPDNFADKLKLTKRQLEIIQLIKQGLSSKQISEKIFLSVHTINTHRKNICRKLGIKSPNGLVKYVHDNF